MTQKPDDYTITRQFVTGIPNDMQEAVFEDRLNVEINTLDEFVESAKAYEVTEHSKKEYSRIHTSLIPLSGVSKEKQRSQPIRDQTSSRPV